MAGFNNFGVPWYAASGTPAIRPKMIPSEEEIDRKLGRYKAHRFLHDYFQSNWKKGDRFVLKEPAETYNLYELLREPDRYNGKQFVTWSGEFVEKRDCGANYWIYVKFDGDQKRRTGSRFGMFAFYHFAEKVEAVMTVDEEIAYLNSLKPGTRVIEAGNNCNNGMWGVVYRSEGEGQTSGSLCVMWADGMGTSVTHGTRRLSDVLSKEEIDK